MGSDDLIDKIQKGWLDFDKAIATPDMMGQVSKLGKILGSEGPHAEPESRHGDLRCSQGGTGSEGGPGGISESTRPETCMFPWERRVLARKSLWKTSTCYSRR